jgi:peptide/nickel transport system substrate-binding protein
MTARATHTRLAICAAAAALLALISSGFASGDANAKTLRYATQDEPQTLDPHSANLAVTNRLLANIYEGLVFRDKDYKLVPWLATSWTQPDAKTWRFKLRPNVKFHDGASFSADDVVFSVERALHAHSQLKVSVQGVERARKVDELTVDLIMREPNAVLLNHLMFLRIMSKTWSEKNKATVPQNYKDKEETFSSRNANGTGPFMLLERQADVRTILMENTNWWNRASPERGNVSRVELLPISSRPTRLAALVSGDVHFVNDPPTQDVARLRQNKNIKVIEGQEARVQFLAFDMARDELLYSDIKGRNPWKDLRVRQAVAHAIDIEAIKQKSMRGFSVPTGTLMTKFDQGYSADADKRLKYDTARARQLLKDAGYANGFAVTLDCGNNAPAVDVCPAVAAMLSQIGIRVTANIMTIPNLFPKLEKADTSFYMISWASPTSDSLYTLQSMVRTHSGTSTSSGDSNYGRYSNKELDRLIDQFKVEPDLKKRDGIIRDALLLVNRELPVVTLHRQIIPWALSAKPGTSVSAIFPPNGVPYFFRFKIQ